MKEIVKSISEALRSRIKNPIIGSFVCAWVVIHWKIVLMLFFGNHDIKQRILNIQLLANQEHYGFVDHFVAPGFATLVLILLTQYIGIPYNRYREWINKKINKTKIGADTDVEKERGKLIQAVADNDLININAIRKRQENDRHDERESTIADEEKKLEVKIKKYSALDGKIEGIIEREKNVQLGESTVATDSQKNKEYRTDLDERAIKLKKLFYDLKHNNKSIENTRSKIIDHEKGYSAGVGKIESIAGMTQKIKENFERINNLFNSMKGDPSPKQALKFFPQLQNEFGSVNKYFKDISGIQIPHLDNVWNEMESYIEIDIEDYIDIEIENILMEG